MLLEGAADEGAATRCDSSAGEGGGGGEGTRTGPAGRTIEHAPRPPTKQAASKIFAPCIRLGVVALSAINVESPSMLLIQAPPPNVA